MSGNPFDSADEEPSASSDEILEGFLCPICRADLKSIDFLTQHFARQHAEEEDALKSVFKDIFTKAKKKILNNFEDERNRAAPPAATPSASGTNAAGPNGAKTSNARTQLNVYNNMSKQSAGAERSHFEYFQTVRNPRLERYASETNKLIIRLHRLLKDLPTDAVQRKQHEQHTVPWLDGSSVKLCPNCAKSFHIARRQHHCRLCGGIMCHDCSRFLQLENACKSWHCHASQCYCIYCRFCFVQCNWPACRRHAASLCNRCSIRSIAPYASASIACGCWTRVRTCTRAALAGP